MEAGIMLEFPLCCLSYPIKDDKQRLNLIISYCIVEYSKKINADINNRIDLYMATHDVPAGYNKKLKTHQKILLAAGELGIIPGYILGIIERHSKLSQHIQNNQLKYGPNSYCRIGKNLCFETESGQFPYRQFAVLCAIQSILGKKAKFKRITKDRIRYAMYGYKSKEVALKESSGKERLLTDRQLGTAIEILHAKGFFSKFTYAKRQTYYSTQYKEKIDGKDQHSDKLLFEAVKNSKVFWAKKKAHLLDKAGTNEIKEEIKNLKLIRFDNQVKSA